MRRFGSTFLTLWGAIFIPSMIVWGLVLRWSPSAAQRFESIWRWCADRLGFPLLLEEQIEWSWSALDTGLALPSSIAFVFLTALWAVMFALPLAVIGAWWVWLTNRGGSAVSADYLAITSPVPALSDTLHSAKGALYLITIPLALIWAMLRAIVSPFSGETHPVLRFFAPIVLVSGAVFVGVSLWLGLSISQTPYHEALLHLRHVGADIWLGYLDTLKIPAIFERQWFDAMLSAEASARDLTNREWQDYRASWYRQPDLRDVVTITAARHALGAAMVATAIQLLRWIFS